MKPPTDQKEVVRRFYPSGGARYPLEVYLLIQRVDSLTTGLYHYNVKENSLEILSTRLDDIASFKEGLYYPGQEMPLLFMYSLPFGTGIL